MVTNLRSSVYQLVDEGNPLDGPCYRIRQVVSLGGEARPMQVTLPSGTSGWEFPDFYREAVVDFARTNNLARDNFLNGDGAGECCLPEGEFEKILNDLDAKSE